LRLFSSFRIATLAALTLALSNAHAQKGFSSGYDDYGAFANDPVDLEQEYQETFGRFFQTSFLLGSGIFTGDLAAAYQGGVYAGVRFVYYFDKLWAAEVGIGLARHQALYDTTISGPNIDLEISTTLVPASLGFRFAFDPENLPRGFSMMNPFLAAGVEVLFRSESVIGNSVVNGLGSVGERWQTGAVNSDNGVGLNFGGGFEFDVYRRRLFLGLDLRYHFIAWPDRGDIFGTNPTTKTSLTRSGDYITLLGMASYNY